jgi:hypothetical protein
MRLDVPALTVFAEAGTSNLKISADALDGMRVTSCIAEFLTDDEVNTSCTVDPRDFRLATLRGDPSTKKGDSVWFAVKKDAPISITRVVFRHGVAAADGGWFDASKGKPYLEVARHAIPFLQATVFPDFDSATWERVASFDLYPATTSLTSAGLSDGQPFEVRLPQPIEVYGIRVVGYPAGNCASCAELAAY